MIYEVGLSHSKIDSLCFNLSVSRTNIHINISTGDLSPRILCRILPHSFSFYNIFFCTYVKTLKPASASCPCFPLTGKFCIVLHHLMLFLFCTTQVCFPPGATFLQLFLQTSHSAPPPTPWGGLYLPGILPKTPVAAPVPSRGVLGGASIQTNLWIHFAHLHVRDKIVILEEGN